MPAGTSVTPPTDKHGHLSLRLPSRVSCPHSVLQTHPATIPRPIPPLLDMLCGEIWGNQGTRVHHSLSQVSMDTSEFYFVFK